MVGPNLISMLSSADPQTAFNVGRVLGLQDARILVVGCGQLGFSIASAARRLGAQVAVTRTSETKLAETLDALNAITAEAEPAIGLVLDANNATSVAEAADSLQNRWGTLNGQVHIAGGNNPKEFVPPGNNPFDVDLNEIRSTVEDNLMSFVVALKGFGSLLLASEWSSTIPIGSMAGFTPLPGIAGYNFGKSAIHNATQYYANMLALHTRSLRHRVNAIAFGYTETPQNRDKLREPDGGLKPRAKAIMSMHPAGAMGVTDDIAGPAMFLLSPVLSSAVTGVVLAVDRGVQTSSLPTY